MRFITPLLSYTLPSCSTTLAPLLYPVTTSLGWTNWRVVSNSRLLPFHHGISFGLPFPGLRAQLISESRKENKNSVNL